MTNYWSMFHNFYFVLRLFIVELQELITNLTPEGSGLLCTPIKFV